MGGGGKYHNIFSLALLLQIAPVELRCLLSLFFFMHVRISVPELSLSERVSN